MAECSHNCSSCSQSCGSREGGQAPQKEPLHVNSRIHKVIGVVSGKGGVGKSMVTSLLAVEINRRGYHAAILDADVTGPSIPAAFGLRERALATEDGIFPVKTRTGIDVMSVNLLLENPGDPVVWRGPVISGAVKQFWSEVIWEEIDAMFVDMPPGTGDVALTVFQALPVDGIIVVTTPQELVGMIVQKAVKMARMMNVPILGIVENMSYVRCPDCGKRIDLFGQSRAEQTALKYELPLLGQLPIDPGLAALCDQGRIEEAKTDDLTRATNAVCALLG